MATERRYFKLAAAALVSTLLLTACGGQKTDITGTNTQSKEAAVGEKIRIVEWTQGEKVVKLKKEIAETVFPNIEYEYVLVNNNDYLTKLQAALAAGTDVPDIITVEISNRGAVFGMDILENLEAAPYNFDRTKLFDAVIPSLTNEKGELVSLDNQFCPAGFAYNRELTKKYFGVEEPDDVYELVKDWDSFIAAGLKLKETAGSEGVFMMQGMSDLIEIMAGQNSRAFIDGETVDVTARYEEALAAACRIRDLGVPLGSNEKNSTSWNSAYTDGSVIFFNHASWSTNSCIASNDEGRTTIGKWGFCMAPESGWMNGGTSMGIYKDSPNKEAAWEFINYFAATTEGYERIYAELGWMPSFKAFYEGEQAAIEQPFKYADWFGGQNICEYIYDHIGEGIAPYEPQTVVSSTVSSCFRDMSLQYLINPVLTAEEGMQYMKDKILLMDPALTVK